MTSQRKKKPFLAIRNRIFRSLKNRTFPKGLTLAFGPKLQIFFVYVDLEKIRLKIMLTDLHRKKKPFWLRKGMFQIPKNPLFQRG